MSLLDAAIIEQLKAYFTRISEPIEIVSFLDDSDKAKELDGFLAEIGGISPNLTYRGVKFGENTELEEENNIKRAVSFTLLKNGKKTGINFCGIPGGHEFNSFILAILGLAGLGKKLEGEQLNKIKAISKPLVIETYATLQCTHCPDVVQALNVISLANDNISTSMVECSVFSDEAKSQDIQAVPCVYINGERVSVGAKTLDELVNIVAGA